jgi:hypothetical protein
MKNKARDELLATNKERDEALVRVGKKLFGEYWIAGEEPEDELGRGEGLPNDPKRAPRIARAQHRNRAYDWQIGVVIHWLHQRGVECEPESFDGGRFEKFFAESFGLVLGKTAIRKAAVATRMEAGEEPGRGGSSAWEIFRRAICGDTGGSWDQRTIRRDVEEWRAKR